MGAAVVIAVGLGLCPLLSAAKSLIPVKKTFAPNKDLKSVYDKNYEVYKNLYNSNKKNFAALNE